MSYNYTGYVSALTSLLVAADVQGQTNLVAMLPNIIDYAEQRIYRELDLLTTLTSLTTTTTAFNRNVALPVGDVIVQSANLITPANTPPDQGTRYSLIPATLEFINYAYPQSTTLGISPSIATHYALLNNNGSFSTTGSIYTCVLSSPPDANYVIEFVSVIEPTPLSAANPNTYLTIYLPDLFLAASMVFASGYQRDFGSQADDPKMAQSWENQYQLLKQSAMGNEFRKKSQSSQWTTITPSPFVTR